MRALSVEHIYKQFGTYAAVHDVSFQVEAGRLVGLLGPSGSGKTTLLRLIAGLETPDGGSIAFVGQQVNDLPPQKRQIGFVFQQYALFKHMTVFENVAFGLKVLKKEKALC
nr:ATP-binding cassette domain-containing protein [Paenibacillus larvae]